MIEVLSSPSQCSFTTTEGRQPYYHKYTTPITQMRYADSVYNVLCYGVPTVWKTLEGINETTSYAGRSQSIKFYAGNGVPPALLNYRSGMGWEVEYQGKFVAPKTENYTFYFGGEGTVVFQYDTAGDYGGAETRTHVLNIDDQNYHTAGPFSLNAANTPSVTITYTADKKGKDSGFICLWQTDSASYTPEKIVMDGFVFKDYSLTTPSLSGLRFYDNTVFTENENGVKSLTFELPFVSTGSYNYNGYRFKSTSDSYVNISDGLEIKKYRYVIYREGYQNGSDVELINRFTGQIVGLEVKYNKSGQDKIRVTCQDFSHFTKDAINLMSPTPIDYWQAGYLTKEPGRYNGETKPQTFDGWSAHEAYKCMLTDCGISPFSFKARYKYEDYDGDVANGGYLIESIGLDDTSRPYLPINENYGVDILGEIDGKKDDKYGFSISTGERYQDAIDKMMKTFYMKWGFNPEGNPYLKRVNVPDQIINDRDWDNTDWIEKIDVNALKGTYIQSSSVGLVASCDVTGKKIALLVGIGPTCGAVGENTFNLKIRHDSELILDTNYSCYAPDDHFYYDGIDKTTGTNTSLLQIANGLDYDTYRVIVAVLNNSYHVRIEGVLGYNNEYEVPLATFYTGDNGHSGNITQLNVKQDIESQRTDCIVLGRRTGAVYRVDEDGEEHTINPNNPTYTYINSISRDLNSIYISTALNYIGRPKMTIVIDPAILSQDQADFISYNVVREYHMPYKINTFEMQGNPRIEVGDCIAVVDDAKNLVTENDYCWVTGVQNSFGKTYISQIKTTPIKPISSYWKRPPVILSAYDNNYIWNLQIANCGFWGTLSDNMAADTTCAYISKGDWGWSDSIFQTIVPESGYVRIGREVMKYSSADVSYPSNKIKLSGITRDVPSGLNPQVHYDENYLNRDRGDDAIIGFCPYSLASWLPTVEFDLLADAAVDIQIRNHIISGDDSINNVVSDFFVDSLSNIDKDLEGDNFKYLPAGHYSFTWGGFDRRGEYNNSIKTEDERNLMKSNFYARENYKIFFGSVTSQESSGNYHIQDIPKNVELDTGCGKFYSRIRVAPKNEETLAFYQTTDKGTFIIDGDTGNPNMIHSILLSPGVVDLKFSTSVGSLFYVSPEAVIVGGPHTIDTHTYYKYERTNRAVGPWTSNIYNATNYPSCDGEHNPIADTSLPVFMLNRSNPNDYGASRGVIFSIEDYEAKNDNDVVRHYIPTMQFQWVQLGMYLDEDYQLQTFQPIQTNGILNEDGDISLVRSGAEYYFNIRRWAYNKELDFIPKNWLATFKQQVDRDDYSGNDFCITNYLIFSDDLYDLSGRKPQQVRRYVQNFEDGNIFSISNLEDFYEFGNQYDTSASSADSNRGFYQWFDNTNRRHNWFSKLFGGSGIFDQTIEGEILENILTESIHRDNYIVWCDENYVREIRIYDNEDSGNLGVWKNIKTFYNNAPYYLYVPNIWFRYRRDDFN